MKFSRKIVHWEGKPNPSREGLDFPSQSVRIEWNNDRILHRDYTMFLIGINIPAIAYNLYTSTCSLIKTDLSASSYVLHHNIIVTGFSWLSH